MKTTEEIVTRLNSMLEWFEQSIKDEKRALVAKAKANAERLSRAAQEVEEDEQATCGQLVVQPLDTTWLDLHTEKARLVRALLTFIEQG